MDDLIKALTIFRKYGNPAYPTHCEHDMLSVMINPADVSDEDKQTLKDLGFHVDDDSDTFCSYKFGRA